MTGEAAPAMMNVTRVDPGPPWLPVEAHASVGSTNAVAASDPRAWRVVVADEQTAGRGRLGRPWVTSPGEALAVSVVLPHVDGMPLGWVPLLAGLAVREAVHAASGLECVLKWPNDVLVPSDGDRKLAGILCEWTQGGVVVGVGVNVSSPRARLPLPSATSVRAAGGGEVTREALLTAYLRALARWHTDLAARPAAVHDAYRAACATIGREVVIHAPDRERRGRARDVDAAGRLVVESEEGIWSVTAGDVVHVRAAPGLGG